MAAPNLQLWQQSQVSRSMGPAEMVRAAGALIFTLMLTAAGEALGQEPPDGDRKKPAPVSEKDSVGRARVLVMRLEGPVSPVTAEALVSAVDRAERGAYSALVIEIDTPGGLETSMRAMVKRMLASDIPILTWVSPSGARAASA